jgi:LPXTG-motif cell wall-anchored protein
MTRPHTRLSLAVLLLLGVVAAVVLPAAAASATAYRYWGFYELHGSSWAYATKAPTQVTPTDGSVEGWRFAVSDGKTPRLPRTVATFATLCRDTKAEAGKKRVGVVVDFGRAADNAAGAEPPTPAGHCAQVPSSATAADVLAAVTNVRTSKELVCGIDGYPTTGCGDAVKTVSAAAAAEDDSITLKLAASSDEPPAGDGTSTGTWVGIGVVAAAVLALAGLLFSRRRRVARA